jgi:hypothetical protein
MKTGWTIEVSEFGKTDVDVVGPFAEDYARNQFSMIACYPAPHVSAVVLKDGDVEVNVKRWKSPDAAGGLYTKVERKEI